MDFGPITWSGTTSANIERILKLQKLAARIILQTDYSTPSSEIFAELGWQHVNKRLDITRLYLHIRLSTAKRLSIDLNY